MNLRPNVFCESFGAQARMLSSTHELGNSKNEERQRCEEVKQVRNKVVCLTDSLGQIS